MRARRWIGWAGLAVAAMSGAFLGWASRPQPPLAALPATLPAEAGSSPADLEAWLAQTEGGVAGLRSGWEKGIVWGSPGGRKERTGLAIVYFHGFPASRREVSPLCERLGAALGANVYFHRLAGYGTTGEALAAARVEDWMRDGAEALAAGQRLGQRVLVVATSTGATLALALAGTEAGQAIDGLVLISVNLGPRDKRAELIVFPGAVTVLPLLFGQNQSWEPASEEENHHWMNPYPTRAVAPMMDLVKAVRRSPLEQIRQPSLWLFHPQDRVVDPAEIRKGFARLGSAEKSLLMVAPVDHIGNHVLAGDLLSPGQTEKVLGMILPFARRVQAGSGGKGSLPAP